jgi:ribonuclease R
MLGKKRKEYLKKKRVSQRERHIDLSPPQILDLMAEEDRPLLLKEILHRLGLQKEQRQKVREFLRNLADGGKVVRIRGNRYGLPSKMNLIVGRLKTHPDGYGFVIPESEGEEDIFISPRNLKEAMHGDRVVARIESIRRKGKEGSVIRILERKTRKVVGKFMRGKNYS